MPLTHDRDASLTAAWQEARRPYGSHQAAAHKVYTELVERYSKPDRFYHTLAHVAAMLHTLDVLRAQVAIPDLDAVRLAVWFHDAVYDATANDNEERSAALAAARLPLLGVPDAEAESVEQLILDTKAHHASPGDIACQALLDADLAVLGAPEADYDTYVRDIRREYAWVTADDWRAGRARVLQSFLGRGRIFQTHPMFLLLEDSARQNLRRELGSLV